MQRLARLRPRLIHITPATQSNLMPRSSRRARMGLINIEPDQVRPEPSVPMKAVSADEEVDIGSMF